MIARIQGLIQTFAGDELAQKLARGGMAAFIIKVGAAGFSFIMFLALARALGEDDFGRFGFGFSLATLIAVAGSFGQRALILKYAPVYISNNETKDLTGVMRYGYGVVLTGCTILALLLITYITLFNDASLHVYLIATAIFAIVLALAEYQAPVLRAFGGMTLALAPRDVIWRGLVILICLPTLLGFLPQFSAQLAFYTITALLTVVLTGQALMHTATRPKALFFAKASYKNLKEWRGTSYGLWASSFIMLATPNAAIIILGLYLEPEATGPFFAALRLAMLLNLFFLAAHMISAPLISKHYHAGDMSAVQRLCRYIALGTSTPTFFLFAGFLLFGDKMLEWFGHGFASAYPALLIISLGHIINSMAGPTMEMMEMTGHEKTFSKILFAVNLIALAGLAISTPFFGIYGAAFFVAFSQCAWNLICIFYVRRQHKIDPSLLSFLSKN